MINLIATFFEQIQVMNIESLTKRTLKAGECLFSEGDKGDFAYIVEEGEMEIATIVDGKHQVLNVLQSQSMFGELALIDDHVRSASAYAKTDVLLTVIKKEQIQTQIEQGDIILRHLLMKVLDYFRSETERLRLYQYSQNLKREINIRQEALQQAFTEIHNGPLQTLALLLRQIQEPNHPSQSLFSSLKALDQEIREIGDYLTHSSQSQNTVLHQHQIHLGQGTILELDRPLHELFYEIFTLTLERNFPYFQTLRVKVRNFDSLEDLVLEFNLKRKLCFYLEEAICNVGKHAKGATRIMAIGKREDNGYRLTVKDNGCGLVSTIANRGTRYSQKLTNELKGSFRRESLSEKGTICELFWSKSIS